MADGEAAGEILDAVAPGPIAWGKVRITGDGTGAWAGVLTASGGRPDLLAPGQHYRLRINDQEPWAAVVESTDRMTVRLLSPSS